MAFIPFIWGLGTASAGATLTFRRGSGFVGFFVTGLTLLSGAYFPVDLLPGWLEALTPYNPLTVAVDGMRGALLYGADWPDLGRRLALLLPLAGVAVVAGAQLFKLAVRREQRRGSLGLY